MAFLFGAIVGSFLNVVIARVPRGESVVTPRSHCPHCGDQIPGWLNIPILSWLMLRGRCRACRAPISTRYPMVELLTATLFLACVARYGISLAAIAGFVLTGALVAITFIDIDVWEIPDEISIPGMLVGAVLRPFAFDTPWYEGVLGALVGAGMLALVRWGYWLVRRVEGMGLGDLKLLAMIGAFLGPSGLIPTVLVGSISGSILGGLLMLFGRKSAMSADATPPPDAERHTEDEAKMQAEDEDEGDEWVPPPNAVPFGPFLSLGAITQFLLGPNLGTFFFDLIR